MQKRVESINGDTEIIKLASFNTTELSFTKQEAQNLIIELSDAVQALIRAGEIKHARQLHEIMHGQRASNIIKAA